MNSSFSIVSLILMMDRLVVLGEGRIAGMCHLLQLVAVVFWLSIVNSCSWNFRAIRDLRDALVLFPKFTG